MGRNLEVVTDAGCSVSLKGRAGWRNCPGPTFFSSRPNVAPLGKRAPRTGVLGWTDNRGGGSGRAEG